MRTFTRGALAVAIALLLAGPALAQIQIQIGGDPGQLSNPFPLVKSKEVQQDLKLSKEQLDKIGKLEKEYNDSLKGLDLQNIEEFIQKILELNPANHSRISEVLKEDQKKRLKQLKVQQHGVDAFDGPIIRKNLDLTEEQQQKIREHRDKVRTKIEEIQGTEGSTIEEKQKSIAQLQKGAVEEVIKLLTPEQKTKWRDVAGEPFKGTLPPSDGAIVIQFNSEIPPFQANAF